MSVALLNDTETDAEGCVAMLMIAKGKLEQLEMELSTSILDRETYLQKVGLSIGLRQMLKEMQREYDRRFMV